MLSYKMAGNANGELELYREDQEVVRGILEAILPQNFANAFASTLGPLVGRNDRRAVGHHDQWRTVMPYLASLTVWCLSGQVSAPGNAHVEGTDHTNGGQNVHHDLGLNDGEMESIRDMVRALFPFPGVQARGHAVYTKRMVIIDRRPPQPQHTYLLQLVWNHNVGGDFIAVNVRQFNVLPPGQLPDLDAIEQEFQRLGL